MRDYGLEIRRIREKAHLTQQQVADIMGWDSKKLSRMENGKQKPYIDEYDELMEVLSTARLMASFEVEWPVGQLSTVGRV